MTFRNQNNFAQRYKVQGLFVLALVAFAAIFVGCGGSSDSDSGSKIQLVAYSTPQTAYEEGLEPGFNSTTEGEGVDFSNSFGASGDQSRAVESGQQAAFVNFALETDVTRLVDSGQVADTWRDNKYKGIVTNSVVSLVVRPGNPEGVESFQDLIDKDVEVVTPNPFTSGGARWNIMAIYGAALNEGKSKAEALDQVKAVLEKTPAQPESARVALQAFIGGAGDVLLSYENEAIAAQTAGEDVEYVVPDDTILIEQPAAVTVDSPPSATDFLNYLWTDPAQQIWQEQGYRSVNPDLLDEQKYPIPSGLFTIDDLGGWDKVATDFFDEENGSIAKINEELGVQAE
ncbi:MAG: extracellular solute-binding protein [Solirubrobacterales bacterium]